MSRPADWHVLDLPGNPIDGDPAPGDPFVVRQRAQAATAMADDAERAEADVRSLAGDNAVLTWIGAAGDTFRGAFGDFPGQLRKLSTSYRLAGDALSYWADQLTHAQSQADDALAQGRQICQELDGLNSQLSVALDAQHSTGASAETLAHQAATQIPPPDPAQVQQAVRDAASATTRVGNLRNSLSDAESRLRAVRSLADQARELRHDGARTTKQRLHEAADAGIHPNSMWHNFTSAVSKAWHVVVQVAEVVAVVAAVVALFVGGPFVLAVLLVASAVLLADSLIKYAEGKGSLLDVALNALAVIPGVGLVGRLGRLIRTTETGVRLLEAGGRGVAAARESLTALSAALRSGAGRRLALLAGDEGSVSLEFLLGLGSKSGKMPDWLVRVTKGNVWHIAEQKRLQELDENYVAELHVEKPARPTKAGQAVKRVSHNRVDGYNDLTGEIISMKYTQLADIDESTAKKYIDELATKYASGTQISAVPSTPKTLIGRKLEGQLILHIPRQARPIPVAILRYARLRDVSIVQAPG